MKNLREKIEKFVDKFIPVLVILLGIILILEFSVDIHQYEEYIRYFDYFVVGFFVLDLFFKWTKVHNVKKFFRLYWIDIIAVFPFYLIFRVYLFFTEIAKATEEAQKILHEAVLIRETKFYEVAKEAELARKETRIIGRLLRTFQRFIRFLKGRWYLSRAELLRRHLELKRKKEF